MTGHLEEARASLASEDPARPGDLDLAAALRAGPGETYLTPEVVDLVARKAHVAGAIHAAYSPAGKRRRGARPLEGEELMVLAGDLLVWAGGRDAAARWKAVNAALVLRDLAGAGGHGWLDEALTAALEEEG